MVEPSTTKPRPEWIGLALSGGGFRATLFHLGVVRLLRDCGLLPKVKMICSVSGGSILAAHLALNWNQYVSEDDNEFDSAAKSITDFTKMDLRNRIIRRWLCIKFFLSPLLLSRLFEKLTSMSPVTWLLTWYYNKLYEKATFRNLAGQPELHILATSLTTGKLCKFTNHTFEVVDSQHFERVNVSLPQISLAVAASSAFPLFFPPVRINHRILKCDENSCPHEHVLTDGGVFDNLGLQELAKLAQGRNQDGSLLIVSDAGANFDWRVGKKYSSVISLSRNVRANDIMMHRLSELVVGTTEHGRLDFCKIEIGRKLERNQEDQNQNWNQEPTALLPETQTSARNMRTDFNSFSETEIDTLTKHGYSEARAALREAGICSRPPGDWNPVGKQPPGSETMLKIEDAKARRWIRLFAPRDMATWGAMCGPLLWGLIVWALVVYLPDQRRLHEQQHEQEMKERTLQQSVLAYQEVNAQLQGDRSTRLSFVKVVDPSNSPVVNVTVDVEVGGIPKTKGSTDSRGLFAFSWEPARESGEAHVRVKAPGFWMADEVYSLNAEPVRLIQLNKGN